MNQAATTAESLVKWAPAALAAVFLTAFTSVAPSLYGFVVLVAAAAISLLACYPRAGLYLLAFSLPVTSWYFTFGETEIPWVDIVGLTLLAAYGVRLAVRFLTTGTLGDERPALPLALPFAALLAAAVLSLLTARDPGLGVWYIVRWFLPLYFVYVVLPYNLITDTKTLRRTVAALIAAVGMVAAMGLASLPGQDIYNEFVRIRPVPIAGIYPIEENQKHIAETIVSSVFLIYAWVLLRGRRHLPAGAHAAVAFFAVIALGSFARTAWLVLAMQATVFCYYQVKRGRWRWDYIAGTALAVAVLALPAVWYMFALHTSRFGVGSTESRWLMTTIGLEAFARNPITGLGPGSFESLLRDNIYFFAKYNRTLDAHGIIQKVSTEMGLLGLAALGWIAYAVAQALRQAWRATADRIRAQEVLLYIVLSVGGVFIFELFDTFYYKGKLWFLVGLALAAARLASQRGRQAKTA